MVILRAYRQGDVRNIFRIDDPRIEVNIVTSEEFHCTYFRTVQPDREKLKVRKKNQLQIILTVVRIGPVIQQKESKDFEMSPALTDYSDLGRD